MGVPGAAFLVVVALRRMRAACEKARASGYGAAGALERELAAIEVEHGPLPPNEPGIDLAPRLAGVDCLVSQLVVGDREPTFVRLLTDVSLERGLARWAITRQHGMSAYPAYWDRFHQRWHQTRFAENAPPGAVLDAEETMRQLRIAIVKDAW